MGLTLLSRGTTLEYSPTTMKMMRMMAKMIGSNSMTKMRIRRSAKDLLMIYFSNDSISQVAQSTR